MTSLALKLPPGDLAGRLQTMHIELYVIFLSLVVSLNELLPVPRLVFFPLETFTQDAGLSRVKSLQARADWPFARALRVPALHGCFDVCHSSPRCMSFVAPFRLLDFPLVLPPAQHPIFEGRVIREHQAL